MNQEKDGRTELRHEPEPGYRMIFHVVFLIAVVYLAIIMAATL